MKEKIKLILDREIAAGSLLKIIFSRPTDKTVLKCTAKPFSAKGEAYLQFETFCSDGKAYHKNLPATEAAEHAAALIGDYRQCNILATGGGCEIKVSKKGDKITVSDKIHGHEPAKIASHNKEKKTILRDGEIYPFLIALGISDKNGRIYDKKRAKYNQINRFLEIIDDIYPHLPGRGLITVCDLCCGKSYLTFAAYHYFTCVKNRKVTVHGMDRKEDVIAYCADTARSLGYEGMIFRHGDVSEFSLPHADLVLSLHACDIATDIVLAAATRMQADVILSTPCCHHEMMKQLDCSALGFIADHSLLKQKLCDAATDALRAARLEAEGYKVTAIELIDPENTPKNILLRALRHNISEEQRAEKLKQYYEHCAFLGVKPYLDRLLSGGTK